MSLIKDVVMSASVAIGNTASRERDRELETVHEDGRPKALGERARQRWNAMIGEGFGKVVVAQTAHLGAKELAKRVGNETAKRIFTEIGPCSPSTSLATACGWRRAASTAASSPSASAATASASSAPPAAPGSARCWARSRCRSWAPPSAA
jgi:hypothetical protein